MGISQAQKFIFLCHWVMHFLRCNQLDFQVVTIENEDSSGFRLELAKHGESSGEGRCGPCPHGPKEATRGSVKGAMTWGRWSQCRVYGFMLFLRRILF